MITSPYANSMKRFLFVFCSFFAISSCLKIERVVGLYDKPKDVDVIGRQMQMVTSNGTPFTCFLPDTKDKEMEHDAIVNTKKTYEYRDDVPVKTKQEEKKTKIVPEMVILRKMQSTFKDGSGCLYLTIEYWTYEVCPFQSVLQFHARSNDPSNKREARDPSFDLGHYVSVPDANSPLGSKKDSFSEDARLLSAHRNARVGASYSQYFNKGANNRQTTVYYVCVPPKLPSIPKGEIVSVSEPKPFHYIVIINSHYACPDDSIEARDPTKSPSLYTLLLPLIGNCMTLNTGWWLYEFCFGKFIRQYHQEVTSSSSTPSVTSEFILGHFSYDPLNSEGKLIVPPKKKVPTLAKLSVDYVLTGKTASETRSYVSFNYSGGTMCSVAEYTPDKPPPLRSTEIRIYCDDTIPAGNEKLNIRMESLEETVTCHYVAKVYTNLICSHEAFTPPTVLTSEIVCVPSSSIGESNS